MEVRFKLTKYRVAMAALFVLAGVGLGNLLSPLVGNALATVGQTVNISDHSASAYFAKVDSNGALKTIGTLTGGNVSISAPQSAFGFADHLREPGVGSSGPRNERNARLHWLSRSQPDSKPDHGQPLSVRASPRRRPARRSPRRGSWGSSRFPQGRPWTSS